MRLKGLVLLVLFISTLICSCTDLVVISGVTTDFNNKPIDSIFIEIKDRDFNTIYSTISDSKGFYSLQVIVVRDKF